MRQTYAFNGHYNTRAVDAVQPNLSEASFVIDEPPFLNASAPNLFILTQTHALALIYFCQQNDVTGLKWELAWVMSRDQFAHGYSHLEDILSLNDIQLTLEDVNQSNCPVKPTSLSRNNLRLFNYFSNQR